MYSTIVIAALMALGTHQAEPVRQTASSSSMSVDTGKNDCMAGGKTDDGTKVMLGLGIADNTFTLAATRPSWDIADGQDADATDKPVTIRFADGQETTSRHGGYTDGFSQGIWGTWHSKKKGVEQDSLDAFEMLRRNNSAEISIAGKKAGSVQFGMPGQAYQWIKACLADERAKR